MYPFKSFHAGHLNCLLPSQMQKNLYGQVGIPIVGWGLKYIRPATTNGNKTISTKCVVHCGRNRLLTFVDCSLYEQCSLLVSKTRECPNRAIKGIHERAAGGVLPTCRVFNLDFSQNHISCLSRDGHLLWNDWIWQNTPGLLGRSRR